MLQYEWPGNVRELKNVIERAVLVEADDLIRPEHLMLSRDAITPSAELQLDLTDLSIAGMERKLIEFVLREKGGHKGQAARALAINRSTLYNKIKEYDIQAP
jgi:DNA-binding NtrC family response regulator